MIIPSHYYSFCLFRLKKVSNMLVLKTFLCFDVQCMKQKCHHVILQSNISTTLLKIKRKWNSQRGGMYVTLECFYSSLVSASIFVTININTSYKCTYTLKKISLSFNVWSAKLQCKQNLCDILNYASRWKCKLLFRSRKAYMN